MIHLLEQGRYKLIETRRHTKILYLGQRAYAWVNLGDLSELLNVTHNVHKTDYFLSTGHYRLYNVKDEPELSDHTHLELEAGPRKWQGYLLLSGTKVRNRRSGKRIIPTTEKIEASPVKQEARP